TGTAIVPTTEALRKFRRERSFFCMAALLPLEMFPDRVRKVNAALLVGEATALMVGEADPPPHRPRHAASPSSAPDGRRRVWRGSMGSTTLAALLVGEADPPPPRP